MCCCGSAGDKFNDYMVTNAIVKSDGTVLWLFPALIKTYCTLNVKYFPFDTQTCDIVFISWTFSGHELNVSHSKSFDNGVYYKSENQVLKCKRSCLSHCLTVFTVNTWFLLACTSYGILIISLCAVSPLDIKDLAKKNSKCQCSVEKQFS